MKKGILIVIIIEMDPGVSVISLRDCCHLRSNKNTKEHKIIIIMIIIMMMMMMMMMVMMIIIIILIIKIIIIIK